MKRIIFVLVLILIVSGCSVLSPDEIVEYEGDVGITRSGDKVCTLSVVELIFENASGYVFYEDGMLVTPIRKSNYAVHVPPYPGVMICANRSFAEGTCVDKIMDIEPLCSACVYVDESWNIENLDIIKEGIADHRCLDFMERQYLESRRT